MKSLQSAAKDLEAMGVTVRGISRDSVEKQSKFAEKCELKMPLLSDPDGSAVAKFDVAYEGKAFSRRVTFVIDPKGVIRMRNEDVSVRSHGADLVEAIGDMQ